MQLEKLFELVRKEEVVLWVGSGFSLYAGYPSGKKLAEHIYALFPPVERSEIDPNLPLAEVAEQFVRNKIGNRSLMNKALQRVFHNHPVETKWHALLSQIPHIRTIISTNYDRLFEMAYKDQLQPIIFAEDVGKRDHRIELFKVHGDIGHPETILITKGDYTRFFYERKQDDLMWSAIKERVSNKHILFIGYDLEDENVKLILQQIAESLRGNRKEMFLIAPNFKQSKIQYLAGLGITYFNYKGEVFADRLLKNIKDQIAADSDKGYVSAETLRKFLSKNNLVVGLKAIENRFKISSVNSTNNAEANMSIKFKNQKQFLEPLNALVKGHKFGELNIEGHQIDDLKVYLNEINIISDNFDDYRIRVASKARHEGRAYVIFEDGSEFDDLDYKLYTSGALLEIVVKFKNSELSCKIDNKEFKQRESINGAFNYEQKKPFERVNDAVFITALCLNMAKGLSFTVYLNNQDHGTKLALGPVNFPIKQLESNLSFFKSLKETENIYGIRFTNFLAYTKDDFYNTFKAVLFANGNSHEQDWDKELIFDTDKGTPLELLLKMEEDAQLTVETTESEVLEILGRKIEIGYQVAEPLDLFITNLDQLTKRETTRAIIRSKSQKVRLRYKKSILPSTA